MAHNILIYATAYIFPMASGMNLTQIPILRQQNQRYLFCTPVAYRSNSYSLGRWGEECGISPVGGKNYTPSFLPLNGENLTACCKTVSALWFLESGQ
jgi:hypothetical protein